MSLLSFIRPLLLYVDLKPLEGWFMCLVFARQWILLVQRYFPLAFTSNFPFHRSVSAAISRCFLSGLTAVTSAAGELVRKDWMRKEKRVREQYWQYSVFKQLQHCIGTGCWALQFCLTAQTRLKCLQLQRMWKNLPLKWYLNFNS